MNTVFGYLLRKMLVLLILFFLLNSCNHDNHSSQKKTLRDNPLPTMFEMFYEHDNISLIIETDISLVYKNKNLEGNFYQPAKIIAQAGDKILLNTEMEIRPRGITRRKICDFPPLMLKLPKGKSKTIGLSSKGNIKIVNNCKDSTGYDQSVLKEYLCYKYFNLFSEQSFDVKRVDITYRDSKEQYPSMTKESFLIEPLVNLSERLACSILNETQKIKRIDKEQYKILTLFQYMIGNTDWNFSKRHNIRLLLCDNDYGPSPIPYDFDYSGLVNAVYAKPHHMMPITDVVQRMLQWRGSVDEDFSETIALFEAKKEEIYAVTDNLQGLSKVEKDSIHSYIDDFYVSIDSPQKIKGEILKARKKQ